MERRFETEGFRRRLQDPFAALAAASRTTNSMLF